MSLSPIPWASFADAIEWWKALPAEDRERLDREHQERRRRDDERQRRQYRVERARRLSHVAEKFADRTFATFERSTENEAALKLALLVADDASAGAWFYGGEGTGKTHLAAAIAHAYIERGVACPMTSVVRLHDDLKAAYDAHGETRRGREDLIASLVSMDSLILDDIDKPVPTPHFTERMYRLVNDRYEAKRPIIVTSNYAPSEIAIAWEKAGGKRGRTTIDRLIEMCRRPGEPAARFAKLTGESRRGVA